MPPTFEVITPAMAINSPFDKVLKEIEADEDLVEEELPEEEPEALEPPERDDPDLEELLVALAMAEEQELAEVAPLLIEADPPKSQAEKSLF